MKPMHVLLISPLPGIDPACGDVTYTETLLANPPEGVVYETYQEALERGSLREHGIRSSLVKAFHTKQGLVKEFLLTGIIKPINILRKKHWLFWEPFRFFTVKPGEYDLIHLHVFSAHFFSLDCPLIVSNAIAQRYLYTNARGYSQKKTKMLEFADMVIGKLFAININSYYLPQTSRVIAFTCFLKDWYVKQKIIDSAAIDIVPIFLPYQKQISYSPFPAKVGFIAKDFKAKGGFILLKAFEIVKSVHPHVQLTIVGCEPLFSESEAFIKGITWITYVQREKLLNEILPTFDIFAYPTEFDGLPLVLLEAMSFGIAIATSDYQAIPEIVDYGSAGLISPVGNVEELAANIIKLLNTENNAYFGNAAYKRFQEVYSMNKGLSQLYQSYEKAIGKVKNEEILG